MIDDAAACGASVSVSHAAATRWASATFTGARHDIRVTGADTPAVRRWLAALPEADLAMRGHLIAELAVLRYERSGDDIIATLEALTVEER